MGQRTTSTKLKWPLCLICFGKRRKRPIQHCIRRLLASMKQLTMMDSLCMVNPKLKRTRPTSCGQIPGQGPQNAEVDQTDRRNSLPVFPDVQQIVVFDRKNG